jgi:hypothetical protein
MKYGREFKKLYNNPQIVVNNLKRVYQLCNATDLQDGKSWYENANSFSLSLSEKYNVDKMKTAGIISALSPQKEWEHNKILAEEFISTGGRVCRHTAQQGRKAKNILRSSSSHQEIEVILGGLKTINFFNNIFNPFSEHHVTVDRHHLYMSIGWDARDCTTKQYEFIKQNTIAFANEQELLPNKLQSILWVCWKRLKKEQNAEST